MLHLTSETKTDMVPSNRMKPLQVPGEKLWNKSKQRKLNFQPPWETSRSFSCSFSGVRKPLPRPRRNMVRCAVVWPSGSWQTPETRRSVSVTPTFVPGMPSRRNAPALRAYLARITRNLALDRYNYNTAAQRSTALTDAFEELEPWIVTGQGDPETELDASELRRVLNGFLRRQSAEARVFFCAATGMERASGRLRKNVASAKQRLRHPCSAHGNGCARNWNRKGSDYESNSFSKMDERRGR